MFFVKVHEIETYSAVMLAYGSGAKKLLATALDLPDEEPLRLPKNIPNKKIARAITTAIEELQSHSSRVA